jgi:molybdopterin-binding protein
MPPPFLPSVFTFLPCHRHGLPEKIDPGSPLRLCTRALRPLKEYNPRYQQSFEEEDMKLSARNILPATVKAITPGAVDTEVVVELAPGIEIVSIITKQSAEKLGLKPGAKAYAIVKASNVMIGVD